MHGRSSKYATAEVKAGSSGGGIGRMYPPRRDVLTGKVVLRGSEAGSSNVFAVGTGNSDPAVGEVVA